MFHRYVLAILFLCLIVVEGRRPSLYTTLGLSSRATPKDIKQAYRRLAMRYHPDRNKEPDAKDRMAEIQTAYDVLKNEALKEEYDRFGVIPGDREHSSHPNQQGGGFHMHPGFDMPSKTKTIREPPTREDGAVLIFFYHHYCYPCRSFMPHWDHVMSQLKGIAEVGRAHIERDREITEACDVRGAPSIALFLPDSIFCHSYSGHLNVDSIVRFVLETMPEVETLQDGQETVWLASRPHDAHIVIDESLGPLVALAVQVSYPSMAVARVVSNGKGSHNWFRSRCPQSDTQWCFVIFHYGELKGQGRTQQRDTILKKVAPLAFTHFPELTDRTYAKLCSDEHTSKEVCLVFLMKGHPPPFFQTKGPPSPVPTTGLPSAQPVWVNILAHPEVAEYFLLSAKDRAQDVDPVLVVVSTHFSGQFCVVPRGETNFESCGDNRKIHNSEPLMFHPPSESLYKKARNALSWLKNNTPMSLVVLFLVYMLKNIGNKQELPRGDGQRSGEVPRQPKPQQEHETDPALSNLSRHMASPTRSILVVCTHGAKPPEEYWREEKLVFVSPDLSRDLTWLQKFGVARDHTATFVAVKPKRDRACLKPPGKDVSLWLQSILDGMEPFDIML